MKMETRNRATALVGLVLLAAACGQPEAPVSPTSNDHPGLLPRVVASGVAAQIGSMMDQLNLALATEGADYRAGKAEYLTDVSGGETGGTVLAKDVGNKHLDDDFVPGDPRRTWSGPVVGGTDNITYAVDQTIDAVPFGGGLSAAQTTAAIDRAMSTWDALACSNLQITKVADFGLDLGVFGFLNGLGGSPFVVADIQHAGFRDVNFAGGVLGVTITFVFIDANGPTDIDGNGRNDVAFREIYYDPSWIWADDGTSNIDVQSIALHEAGHGLSQAHFGKVRIKNDGSIKASPRAVMNALYSAPYRNLAGSDNGGHCSNWANWPNH